MRVFSFAGSSIRHVGGAVLEAVLILVVIAGLVLGVALIAGDDPTGVNKAFAGKSGDSSIELAQVGGLRAGSIDPSLGTTVTFKTTYPQTVKNPRIEVLCSKGDRLVYGEAGGVTNEFLLGGGGSVWKDEGGSVSCVANLFYFGHHAGHQTYEWLARTTFDAGG
jgi:hypothetical protein